MLLHLQLDQTCPWTLSLVPLVQILFIIFSFFLDAELICDVYLISTPAGSVLMLMAI